MKTEKQVRTWWLVAHHSAPEKPIHIFDLHVDEGIKVIAHEDHLAIVAELEKQRDEWKARAEGWFCIGCQKYIKALAEDEK